MGLIKDLEGQRVYLDTNIFVLPGVRTPDAIHAATARLAECDVFLTNDRRLKAMPGLRTAILSDVAEA